MTPADRLLKAADLLEKAASEATEGPWITDGIVYRLLKEQGADVDGPHGGYVARLIEPADARYIAMMHPEVGKAVAAWLRFESTAPGPPVTPPISDSALTLADLVLAGEQG